MRVYFSRVKAGGFALVLLGVVALFGWMLLGSFPYDGLNAWAFQQPVKSALLGPLAAFIALGALVCMYWVVTPLPYLAVDETGLTLRRLPFVKRTVTWADVEDITALKDFVPYGFWRLVFLTLSVDLKPQAVGAYGGKSEVKLGFLLQMLLPISVEEVVTLMRRYHSVDFVQTRPFRIEY